MPNQPAKHAIREKVLKDTKLFEYVQHRYKEALAAATKDEHGCLIAPSHRGDGYAQLHIRRGKKGDPDHLDLNPRTYTLANLHEQIDPKLDFSHICGRGNQGCINPDHVVLESHKKNLQRQNCHLVATCTCCNTKVYFQECKCEPRCIR